MVSKSQWDIWWKSRVHSAIGTVGLYEVEIL